MEECVSGINFLQAATFGKAKTQFICKGDDAAKSAVNRRGIEKYGRSLNFFEKTATFASARTQFYRYRDTLEVPTGRRNFEKVCRQKGTGGSGI